MKKIIMLACVLGLLASSGTAIAKKSNNYWIKKNVTVLVFIGEPNSLKLKTVKYTTSTKQRINLFHKRSGPGVYAFYLPGLIIVEDGITRKIKQNGYFLVKKRHLQKSR